MKLEVYAAQLFSDYAKRQNLKVNWEYLGSDRKLIWINEAFFLLTETLKVIKKQFNPLKLPKAESSYEIGYNQGMSAERFYTLSFFEQTIYDLEQQLQDLQNKYSK